MRLGLGTDISVGYRQPLFGGVPLLLDTYTGAAAAYSLRQLRTGVTNVVRVREDSGNTEQDFTAKEITDGTLLAFVGAGNNGHVVTWYDQSGNGNDATQATAANQPKIVNAGVLVQENGKPAMDFDGVDDYLTASSVSISQPNTNISVTRTTGKLTNMIYDGNSNRQGLYLRNIFTRILAGTSSIQSASDFTNAHTAVFSIFNSSSSENYVNGNLDSSGTLSNEGLSDLYIAITRDFLIPFQGNYQELIFYPSDQSANRTGIETDINDHYNIYP